MFSRQLGSFLAADTDGQVEAYLATLDALVSAVDTHASLLRRHDKSYDPRLEWELQVEAGKELARERLGIKDYLVYKPQESQ